MVPMSYEGLDDEEELKTGSVNNQSSNNNCNAVSDSESKSNDEINVFERSGINPQDHCQCKSGISNKN